MKISFIGAGSISQAHFDALKYTEASVVSVCTRGDSGKLFAEKNSGLKYYAEPESMIKDMRPDAIFILTQPSAYTSLLKIIKPLEIPVFLEKPLGYTVSEAESLKDFLPEVSFVGLNRRFYSNVRAAREIIAQESGFLAELVLPERTKDYANRSEKDRNFWPMLNGIHCIDLISYLSGSLQDLDFIKSWGKIDCCGLPQYTHASYQTNKGNRVSYVSNLDSSGGWRIHIHLRQKQLIISPIEATSVKSLTGVESIPLSIEDTSAKQGFIAQANTFIEGVKNPSALPEEWCSFDSAIESMKLVEMLHPSRR